MASATSSSRIFVRNLPPSISEQDFRAHFSKDREITDVKLFPKRRIGYVGYKTPEDAAKALKYFNKSFIRMSRIAVEVATPISDSTSSNKQTVGAKSSQKKQTSSNDVDKTTSSPLKRKREALQTENVDPKLKEFLGVMQATSKTKIWENDINYGVTQPLAVEESGDELQVIGSKKQKKNRATQPEDADNILSVAEGGEQKKDGEAGPQSDNDWLRSRKGILFEEQNEDDARDSPNEDAENDISQPVSGKEDQAEPEIQEAESEPQVSSEVAQIQEHGRLFLRNLPFTITEDELRDIFGEYGDLQEVHIPMDTSKGSAKGFGFLLFRDPEDAVKAYQAMDGKTLQGRLIHILPANAKRDSKLDEFAISQLPLKQQMKIKRRMESSSATHKWNPLYMNMDDVMSSVSNRLGIEKSELVDATSSDAAVKQALAETHVIQEAKSYFAENGVDLDTFDPKTKRGDTAILVKNFPYGTKPDEIRNLFSPHGQITRLLIPPSATMALVEFAHAPEGRAAFDALKYRRVKDTIIFLEKAPKDVFTKGPISNVVIPAKLNAVEAKLSTKDLLQGASTIQSSETSTLFVRNLNFSTTTDILKETFSPLSGFLTARVKTKTDPKRPNEVLSMGFGFLEFRTKDDAQAAIAAMNSHILEGHELDVRPSQRILDAGEERRKQEKAKALASQQTKVIVKNLPFEATKKDVRTLLGTYGQLRSVRVPKKFDKSARGFAFAEFTTAREAANAMAALKSTHLLGRRLHMEYAAAEDLDPEAEIERMQKKMGGQMDKFKLQKLTGGGRKKFNVAGDEPEA